MKKQKKRTKKIMKKQKKRTKKIMKRTKKIMKGGMVFRFDDDLDDLETFSAMLGDDFDDICKWEGQLPLILSTEVSCFQKNRNSSVGWVFDSVEFAHKYLEALQRVIDIWEEDACVGLASPVLSPEHEENLTRAIDHVRKYQMLLNNTDLSGWFQLDEGLADANSSIEMIKMLLWTVVSKYKIKWTNPYNGNSYFLRQIPADWPEEERVRRKTILQMMDLYDRYSETII
jgi:hypothetical protein